MSELSTGEVAERLGISLRRVQEFVESQQLDARMVGGRYLVEAQSVARIGQLTRGVGRAWSPGTAWAALATLSGQPVDWLAAAQMSRVRHRLRRASADEVQGLARFRAAVHRFDASDDVVIEMRNRMVATGLSAIDGEESQDRFGLASAPQRGVDGYLATDDLARTVAELHLIADPRGELIVRAVKSVAAGAFAAGDTPLAAVAVDLMDSLDSRAASAGRRTLEGLLRAY